MKKNDFLRDKYDGTTILIFTDLYLLLQVRKSLPIVKLITHNTSPFTYHPLTPPHPIPTLPAFLPPTFHMPLFRYSDVRSCMFHLPPTPPPSPPPFCHPPPLMSCAGWEARPLCLLSINISIYLGLQKLHALLLPLPLPLPSYSANLFTLSFCQPPPRSSYVPQLSLSLSLSCFSASPPRPLLPL